MAFKTPISFNCSLKGPVMALSSTRSRMHGLTLAATQRERRWQNRALHSSKLPVSCWEDFPDGFTGPTTFQTLNKSAVLCFNIIWMEEMNFILDPHCCLPENQCLEKENQKNMVSDVFLLT